MNEEGDAVSNGNMEKQIHQWKPQANWGVGERAKRVPQRVGRFGGGGEGRVEGVSSDIM